MAIPLSTVLYPVKTSSEIRHVEEEQQELKALQNLLAVAVLVNKK